MLCTLKRNERSWHTFIRSVPPTFPRHQAAPETHLHACSQRANVEATFSNNSESLVPTPGAKWFLSSPVLQWPHYWLVTVLEQTARLSRPVVNLSARLPWIKCVLPVYRQLLCRNDSFHGLWWKYVSFILYPSLQSMSSCLCCASPAMPPKTNIFLNVTSPHPQLPAWINVLAHPLRPLQVESVNILF